MSARPLGLVGATLAIARKDLRIELRTKEVTLTTAFFAVLVVILSSLSFYLNKAMAARIAPGVLWVSLAFAGQVAVLRSWGRERENDALRGLLASPIPRAAIYFGKLLSGLAVLVLVTLVVVPLVGLFFHLEFEQLGWIALLLLMGATGFVAAGTLFGALTVSGGAREVVLSLVVFPLVTPALLAGVVATRALMTGAPASEVLDWIGVLGAFDVIFLVAGGLLFDVLLTD